MSQDIFENQSDISTESEEKIKEPKMYRVLLHNDDYTTMEFVVSVLKTVFHKPTAEATRIMYEVHQKGIGIAGIYTFEIAETKAALVHALAHDQGFPLRCSIEPE